jgi:hypothetical protein
VLLLHLLRKQTHGVYSSATGAAGEDDTNGNAPFHLLVEGSASSSLN